MALESTVAIEQDGFTYKKLAANLALSPLWRSDGVGVSIAVQLTPYRNGNDGPAYLEDRKMSLVFGDATVTAEQDPDVAQFLTALEAAAQAFINAKGI